MPNPGGRPGYVGERISGPVLLGRNGDQLNRQAATRVVVRLAKQAGVSKHISPHSLWHSFITAALDAGCLSGTSRSPPGAAYPRPD